MVGLLGIFNMKSEWVIENESVLRGINLIDYL